ncbi:hypothetical protein KKG66_07215 [bacterium]|nr:hypothetical protein [bacterium]
MSNTTLNYLYATQPLCTLAFSGLTTTTSINLNGPGGQNGDGFPIQRDGDLTGISVWDGSTVRNDGGAIALTAGDRLSVYCQNTGSDFTVKVRVNGVSTSMQTTGIPHNSTLLVMVEFTQNRGSETP